MLHGTSHIAVIVGSLAISASGGGMDREGSALESAP